jgi:hypothetical protein
MRRSATAIVLGLTVLAVPAVAAEPYRVGRLLHADDFRHGLDRWAIEAERPATVTARDGVLDLDTPEGLTVWFRAELHGPVMIEYQATAVAAGGPNDRVSDLNAFWMATDPATPDLLAAPRGGAFAAYDGLKTYYVGQGGNGNTTTRFRRYVGRAGDRPLLPENDRGAPADLLVANQVQTIRLVAYGDLIQYWRDGQKLFEYRDPQAYAHGWFGLRTTKSHLRIGPVRIHALIPAPGR